MKRIFMIVLDSFGIGKAADAEKFGDAGADTLGTVFHSKCFNTPVMKKLGLFNIDGVEVGEKEINVMGAYGRLTELSDGKDTTTGHWELAGVISERPFPTFPCGFPQSLLDELSKRCGRGILCNKTYSGTEVIKDYGAEHVKTGNIIVYTSADSVLQIAAHEEVVPLEELYSICRTARKLCKGDMGVGRIIARPFIGNEKDGFTRTANRHDFSLEPTGKTVLDAIKEQGKSVIAVGKITDIFAGVGITETILSHSNNEGMNITKNLLNRDFEGLCFTNLVEFDMLYGHRNDVDGYAQALTDFDKWLESDFIPSMNDDDCLIITADHGCDPGYKGTDHTRERVPVLVFGRQIDSVNIGTRETFSDVAATVADLFGIDFQCKGKSFANLLTKKA